MPELKVLLSRQAIATRVAEMGATITHDFAGESVVLVGVLKGAAVFLCDLARQIPLDARIDFLSVSSYGGGKTSSGEVQLVKDIDQPLAGQNVILVEDILDTGNTLAYLRTLLLAHQPRSLKLAVLLNKPARRAATVHADYIGFTIGDEFVVGYGLDHAEQYRNLPDICVLRES